MSLYASLYFGFLAVYAGATAERLIEPSFYNHYTYLADSFLHGRLDLVRPPPHQNDWAQHEGRWFVSFPPVPAILMTPGVALWGWDAEQPSSVPTQWQRLEAGEGRFLFNEPLFVLLFTPVPPLLLLMILGRLRKAGRSQRTPSENLLLVTLFGLGTVYCPAAVQADTWHIAHVFGCSFLGLYVLASLDGRHPVLAGLSLGLAFGSRTPLVFAFPLFVYEVARSQGVFRLEGVPAKLRAMMRRPVVLKLLIFGLVTTGLVGLWLVMNDLRFGSPFDFGHRHLMVRWSPRIQQWGLFDLHYLPRNLSAALTLMPWVLDEPPYFQFGHHGMAIWITTPVLLYLLWPKRRSIDEMKSPPTTLRWWPTWRADLHIPLWICIAAVALPSLLYQNTGWVQFGYRYSNDYMLFFIMLLAIGDRPMTRIFRVMVVISIVMCLFGAVTFNRVDLLYNQDLSQDVFFQPD